MVIIGYSGHGIVTTGLLKSSGIKIHGYCDHEEKKINPLNLPYFGREDSEEALIQIRKHGFFIAIGNNQIRRKIQEQFQKEGLLPINVIHPLASIDSLAQVHPHGVLISAGVYITALATLGTGVICSTGCIIEHENTIHDFAHIATGVVLNGNITIGENSFIGAGSVVKQGITIGSNVIVGAGAIVLKDIPDNQVVIGNPARLLKK